MRKLAVLFVSTVLSLLLLEGLCTGVAWHKHRTLNVAELNAADVGNTYVADNRNAYATGLIPHPYLSEVRNDEPANNVGCLGPDFPIIKDDSKFTVLVTGGSVASQLCTTGALDNVLPSVLSEKPLLVLNGAGGGWHYPQQLIMLSLYGEIADAVIDVSGFNELANFDRGRQRIETPNSNFAMINPLMSGGFDRLGAAWGCQRVRHFSIDHNSRALFFLTKAIRGNIESSVRQETEGLDARKIFALPREWSNGQQADFNAAQLRKYIGLMHVSAEHLGIREAHFIQPVPAIGKTLTADERRVVGNLDYADSYQRIERELLAMDGVPVVSLANCFEDVSETIYADSIHCNRNGPGYRIMAERIADELAKLWKLPAKQHDGD